jgi:ABC-type nitrate/sulfonate/bicarbonate transport system substrate-binding protein
MVGFRILAGSLAALIAALFAVRALAAEPIILHFGVDTEHNINALALIVADREGFLARYGLKLEQTRFLATGDRPRDRNSLLASLKDGTVNITRVQTPYLFDQVEAGANIAAIAGVVNNPVYFLMVDPKIRTFADLAGKRLAEPSPGDIITLTARKLLTGHGLKDGQVQILDIAGSGPRVRCLMDGRCDAVTVSQPSVFNLMDAGFRTLALHTGVTPPLLYVVDIVDRDWAAAHRDVVDNYIRATADAMRFIHDPKNRERVVADAIALTGEPEKNARAMLDYYWKPEFHVLPQAGEIDVVALESTMRLLAEYGYMKTPLPPATRFVDLSYAREASVH